MDLSPSTIHPEGEKNSLQNITKAESIEVETFDGKVFIEWDPTASVTPLAQLPFFIEFLKLGCRFEPWVEDCLLEYNVSDHPLKLHCQA